MRRDFKKPYQIGSDDGSGCIPRNHIFQIFMLGQPASGMFQVGVDGEFTTSLAYDADGATVEAAIEALSNVGVGNVSCTGAGFPEASMLIEFVGDLAKTFMPPLTCVNNLVGESAGMFIGPMQLGGPNEF